MVCTDEVSRLDVCFQDLLASLLAVSDLDLRSQLEQQVYQLQQCIDQRIHSYTTQLDTIQKRLNRRGKHKPVGEVFPTSEERLPQQHEYLAALYETTLGLIHRLDVTSLLHDIVTRAGALLGTTDGYLYLIDAANDELEMKVATGVYTGWIGYRQQRGEGLAGRVWATGQALTINDYEAWEGGSPELRNLHLKVITGVPLRTGQDFIGVLGLHRRDGQTFTPAELDILSRFGHLASLALDNARLYTAAQQELADRRRVATALRASELRLRRLVEHLPAGAIYIEGDRLFLNRGAETITGYARSELADKEAWAQKLFPTPEQTVQARAAYVQQVELGLPVVCPITRKDGAVRQIEFVSYREETIEVWLLRDVTESERQARLLAQTERAAQVGGWELHIATRSLYWTPEMYRILEASPETFRPTPESTMLLYTVESFAQFHEASQRCLTTGEPFDLELELITIRGRHIWARVTGNAERHLDDTITLFGSLQDITARKQVEESLRKSEEKYRVLVETTNTGYLIADVQGRLLDANAEYVRLTGRQKLDEILEHPFMEWTAPHDIERSREATRQCMEQGFVRNLEIDYIDPDGHLTPTELNATLIQTNEGSRILALCRDVSRRRQAEATLRESEERFRQLAEHIEEAFWLANETGMLYISPAYERIWGRPRAHFYQTRWGWLEVVHPEDQERVRAALDKQLAGTYDEEYRVVRPDSSIRWVRDRAFPIRDAHGQIYRVAGLAEDITVRKQVQEELTRLNDELEQRVHERTAQLATANEALQESAARHQALLEAMPDMFFRSSREGVFRDISAKPGQTIIPVEQIVGAQTRDLPLPPDVINESMAAYERAIKTGEMQTIEYSLPTADGSAHYESRIVRSGFDEVVVIVRDVTDRKRAELQIRQLNEDLEERVRQRTAELEVANRELESFSFTVSHDLRAPLRAINGFSQALLEDYGQVLDEQAQRYLNRLRASSQRMGRLIDDLLNLSRVTRHEIYRIPISLSNLATSIASELCAAHPQRQVEFVVTPDLWAEADPKLMRIALDNLLNNAWKYTGKRQQAHIEFGMIIHNEQPIYFVKDNGAGFDMTYIDKLFHAFQRLHREEEFEGTGIGLATVERIIRRHGGRVWAESVTGQSAIFYFTLG